jgi:hypothetical protein
VVALSSSAYAAGLLSGKDIKDHSLTIKDFKKSTVKQLTQPGEPGAPGQNGTNGTNGTNGQNGAPGPAGQNGENADGSVSVPVQQSGDAGVQVDTPSGSGGDNGVAEIVGDNLHLAINSPGGGFARATKTFDQPVPLADLAALVYKFNVNARASGTKVAPTLKLDVVDATPCATGYPPCLNAPFTQNSTTLVYEPTYSDGQDGITSGTVDALGSGNKWWSTRGIEGAGNRDTFVSFQSLIAANPNAKAVNVYIDAGQNSAGNPWTGFDGLVDYLNVGLAGENITRYDFGS